MENPPSRCSWICPRAIGTEIAQHCENGVLARRRERNAELALLKEMEIGLMPLPDDEWTKGKCGLKGLVSMSMGAATVMSPVGVNTEIVQHGENGFLARTEDEWVEVLGRLVDDAPLRRRIGEAGRQTVVQRYSVARWQEPLADLLLCAGR